MKFVFSLILLFPFSPEALNSQKFSNKVQVLLKKYKLKPEQLGLVVSTQNKPSQLLYNLNGEKLFTPASLTKIVTLSALYHYFPTHHKFKTHFLSSASQRNGVLKGDLILQGGGDPGFTSEALWNLVNVFSSLGIKKIEGNLLIDGSLFKTPFFFSRSDRSYEALTSAASFNWNSVTFRIRPHKINKKAFVVSDPATSYIQIINRVKTVNSNQRTKISIVRKSHSYKKEVFEVRGQVALGKKEVLKYRNIQHPLFWLGRNVKNFLNQRGIQVTGQIKKGKCASSCPSLAEWESHPFHWQTYNLMKHSSNFISRMLTIQLSLLKGSEKGNIKKGMYWIREYIKKLGITEYRFVDPAGLSRKNRFRPIDIQKVLTEDLKSYYRSEIFSSYPLAGGVGTLKDRYTKKMGRYPIRAKTGFLSGVLGLAGFANPHKKYVFTFLYNGPYDKVNEAKKLFDELTKSLLD